MVVLELYLAEESSIYSGDESIMGRKLKCECPDRDETQINSNVLFEEIKLYFYDQEKCNVFYETSVETPFYVGYSNAQNIEWYATKWYKCRICGCLWEFNYPDFPAQGFVRKFKDGKYCSQGD